MISYLLNLHNYFIYPLLFVLMVIEGPITTFFSSTLSAAGAFNIYLIFICSVFADLIGDVSVYFLGKYSNERLPFLKKILKKIQQKNRKLDENLKTIINKNTLVFFLVVKWIPGLATVNLFLVGKYKMPFVNFLLYVGSITVSKNFIICLLGYFTIISIKSFQTYLNTAEIIGVFILLLALIFVLFRTYLKPKISKYLKELNFPLVK